MNKIKEKAKNIENYIEKITRLQFEKEINLFKLLPVTWFILLVIATYQQFSEVGLKREGMYFLQAIIILLLMEIKLREMERNVQEKKNNNNIIE